MHRQREQKNCQVFQKKKKIDAILSFRDTFSRPRVNLDRGNNNKILKKEQERYKMGKRFLLCFRCTARA